MGIRSIALSVFIFLSGEIFSQFVQIGEGAYLGTVAGPVITRNNMANYQSKYAYIFPNSVLKNMKHGDSLNSLSFMRSDGDGFNGNCSLRIWLNNTNLADWGGDPISFQQQTSSGIEVYYNHPKTHIGIDDQFYKIPFDKPYFFDSSKGKNLALMVLYEQFDTIKGSVRFYFEGSNTVSGYYTPQVRYSIGVTADDSLRNATEYHPTIRFTFPREDYDVDVRKVYTLGKIPVPLGNPDSVKVLLRNVGKKDLSAQKMYTYSKGANKQRDSFSISLNVDEEQIVNVPSLFPSKKGTDTVYVEGTDKNTSNNTAYSIRLANENIYSYRDITQPPAGGGIGFNGAQGDFVARFMSNKPKNLNQISVAFSGSGRQFKLGIWDHDSIMSKPKTLIWESDSLITKGGTYIYDMPKQVRVEGSFYVGVRQIDLNNVAFGYQMEQPVRPKTFFYAVPLGDTNWVDFNPGAPYKFIIEPRLQADYDVVALDVNLPKDTFNVHDLDTVAPTARIGNIGVNNITDSVRIRCIIRGPNILHYDESVYDTISSGQTRTFTLPKTFDPWEYGIHTLTLIVSHYLDQVIDNDTIVKTFVVGSRRDATVRTAYPSGSSTFVARQDTLQPISTIMNIAFANTGSFNVVSEIWLSDSLLSKNTQSLQLGPQGSQILVWPTYPCDDTGRLKWIVYTALSGDEYTPNDSAIFTAFVYKTIDVAAEKVASPDSINAYKVNENIDVIGRVYNQGVLRADNVKTYFQIFDSKATLLYWDSLQRDVNGRSGLNFVFPKKFKPLKKGEYSTRMFIADSMDLYPENDTLITTFSVGRPTDYYLDSISLPSVMSTDPIGIKWSVKTGNIGYDSNTLNAQISAKIYRNQTQWFEETVQTNALPEEIKTVLFTKPFKPLFTGLYRVEIVVTHPNDANAQNDTLRSTVNVQIGKDVLIDSLSNPTNNQRFYVNDRVDSSLIKVSNQGLDTMKNVRLRTSWAFEKALLFQSTDTFSMAPSESRYFNKATQIRFTAPGTGYYKAWLEHPDDEDLRNDTLIHYYSVRSKRDLYLYNIDSPAVGTTYTTGTKLYPLIYMTNFGTDSAVFSGTLVLELKKNGQNWYSERLPIPVLNPGDSVQIQATQVLYFEEEGDYQLICFAENNTDDNALNDTIQFPITVKRNNRFEANNTLKVFPNPSTKSEVVLLNADKFNKVTMLDAVGKEYPIELLGTEGEQKVRWDSSVAPGSYMLQFFNAEGMQSIRIIVK